MVTILVSASIILMIIFSAFLSAAETSITASSPGKLHKLIAQGNKSAGKVLQILKIKEKVISTVLVGNCILNTISITIATGLFIDLLDDANLGAFVSSVVMSFIIIVFAEVMPKAIAVSNAEATALLAIPVINLLLKILTPINLFLELVTKIFCHLFGIKLNDNISGTEEVRGIIEHHHYEGNVYKSDRDMLGGILDIRDLTVSDIMIHHSYIQSVNIDLPNRTIIDFALASPHSRLPFWKDNKDNIIGILHIKDLVHALYKNSNIEAINLQELLDQPWFVPENVLVASQLQAFRDKKRVFACVVNEYGDLKGVVTLEDIFEEIVGHIYDEHDKSIIPILQKSDSEFIINGSTTIRDINRELNWNLSDSYANTIAGFIIHHIKRIPLEGENIIIQHLRIHITKKILNRIETVQINILPEISKDGK